MAAPFTLAAAQPVCAARDVAANAHAHARAIADAGARLIVFPELSLTGYELDAGPVSPDDGDLRPIAEACARHGSVALVGAPVQEAAGRSIAMLRVDGSGTQVAYRKTWLGGEELERFEPGDGPTVLELDGRRIGLAICKDTGTVEHTEGTAALTIDAYVAGIVHHRHELDEQERRAVAIARATGAVVAFASFAGPTGGGYVEAAGGSAIYDAEGIALARAGGDPGEVVRVELA